MSPRPAKLKRRSRQSIATPTRTKRRPKIKRRLRIESDDFEERLAVAKETEMRGILRAVIQEVGQLQDPALRAQYEEAIEEVAKTGDLARMHELSRYKRSVVPLDEFLFGQTYIGMRTDEMYPGVYEAMEALDSEQYVEAVLKGGIGGGKTTVANLGIIRQIYKIACMRNPQQTFGIQQNSSIVFTIQSVRLSTAKQAVFDELGKFVSNSPFFTEIYPYNRSITSRMQFDQHHVQLLPVSSSNTGAISMNVIGGLLDEMNFMEKVEKSKNANAEADGMYDQAVALYNTLSKRRRSRFMHKGRLPGTLFLVSSSRYPDDFTEVKAKDAVMEGGNDPNIYVWSKSTWDSRGLDKYNEGMFRVLIGDERMQSRILADDEELPDEENIIEVPTDFRGEFDKDVDGSIRDFAGRTTVASAPFIHNREKLFEAMDLAEEYGYENAFAVQDVELEAGIPSALEGRIRDDVDTMRVAHIDLAVTRDSAGLAIGHIAGHKTCERYNPETKRSSVEVLPVIAYDAVLRIMPPRDGEIDFSKIRQIIYELRETHRLPIKVITTDGFQSVDFRQIVAKKGYATELLSMDKTTGPYKSFREAIYDGRVFLPRHNHLTTELAELEYVRHNSKEKVDHKPRGSKDVADAVCGVASYLLTRRSAWGQSPQYAGNHGLILHGNRTSIASVTLEEHEYAEADTSTGRRSVNRKQSQRGGVRRRKID